MISVWAPDGNPITKSVYYGSDPGTHKIVTGLSNASELEVVAAPIFDIQYIITPNEDSVAAQFQAGALNQPLDIDVGDVIKIYTLGHRTGEDTSIYYRRFVGVATTVPNVLNPGGEPQVVRVLGMREALRFWDTKLNTVIPAGQDIRDVFDDLFQAAQPTPRSLSYAFPSLTGVTTTGVVNPGSSNFADAADAIVALGNQGGADLVWVVKPSSFIRMEARDTTVTNFSSSSDDVIVTYPPVIMSSAEPITRVRWLVADGNIPEKLYNGGSFGLIDYSTPDIVTHLSDSGVTTNGVGTVALTPSDSVQPVLPIPISDVTTSVVAGSLVGGALADIWDGDPETSATIQTTAPAANTSLRVQWVLTPDKYVVSDIVGVEINMEMVTSDAFTDRSLQNGNNIFYDLVLSRNGVGTTSDQGGFKIYDGGTPPNIDAFLWIGDRGRTDTTGSTLDTNPITSGNRIWFTITATTTFGTQNAMEFKFKTFRLWVLNTTELDAVANDEYKLPVTDATEVTSLTQVTPTGKISIDGGTPLDVTEYEVNITRDGVITTIRVGPTPLPAVLEEVARRQSRESRTGARITRAAFRATKRRS